MKGSKSGPNFEWPYLVLFMNLMSMQYTIILYNIQDLFAIYQALPLKYPKHGQNIDSINQFNLIICIERLLFFLSQFAVDIETESKEHNKLLDDADSDFDSVFGFLRGGQNRVTRLLGASKGNRKFLFYLSIGLASFLLFSYYLISRSLTSNDNQFFIQIIGSIIKKIILPQLVGSKIKK